MHYLHTKYAHTHKSATSYRCAIGCNEIKGLYTSVTVPFYSVPAVISFNESFNGFEYHFQHNRLLIIASV